MTSNDETTADEPQRIDLTQFEGTIAEGKWYEHIHEPKEDGYERVASIVVSGVVAPPYTLQANEGHTFANVEMGDLTEHLPLFLMVPDLIAELKRMYEREDALMKAREIWLIEERRLEKQVEGSQKEMLQSFVRTSDTEKALRKALRIIRDDLDEVTSSPINEVEKDKLLKKIRNFANDASQ